jgi:hypothetical protein
LTPQQFRAAKELLPYEQPKLTAVALGHFDGTWFAAALERATRCALSSRATSRQRIEGQLSDAKAQPSLTSARFTIVAGQISFVRSTQSDENDGQADKTDTEGDVVRYDHH